MTLITDIKAEEISDSRNRPTIRVTVAAGEHAGSFSVPSGASTGSREAHELRDPDGGMDEAVRIVETVFKPALLGADVTGQRALDEAMIGLDGTSAKTRYGGNTMLGVSIAVARAAAHAQGTELYAYLRTCADVPASRPVPYLYMNLINGGKHASSPLSFQEHMIVPQTDRVSDALDMATRINKALRSLLESEYGTDVAASMGDEGGYVLQDPDPRAPFKILQSAIADAGLTGSVQIAIDAAATSFFADGSYTVGGTAYTADGLADLYAELTETYPILSIEDPFEENSLDDFSHLQSRLAARVVGDDLTATNASAIQAAAAKGAIRAVIIKPNQAGTLSETFDAMTAARANGIDCIVSHRSGETGDDFVADLSFAFGAFGLKAGSPRRPERMAKYERLQRISL